MTYKTKQREYMLEFLRQDPGRHVTVAELVRFLQDNGTPVSTTTVYRNLEQMVSEGVVRKYFLDEQTGACYQYIGEDVTPCKEHFHLKCVQCGRLYHVRCDYLQNLGEHLLEEHGFAIDNTKTVLYGTCAACRGEIPLRKE